MNNNDTAISIQHVSKSFKLPHERQGSIKNVFINMFRRKRTYEKQLVLDDISFEIKKGEFFGIVGRNGSGKSTLLKLLAGIYHTDQGSILVEGKLTPFIELGVGFNPELTGRENVFLNGALLGFDRKQIEKMYDEIVEFAELEKFMDQKLKNYSSGMQVRLAFSIAIRADTDILVLDEVLAVGDANFQQKCFDYFEKIKKANKTIILVTHDMGMVRRFCTRALLIEFGVQKSIGSPDEIASQYVLDNMNTGVQADEHANKKLNPEIKSLDVVAKSPLKRTPAEDFVFEITYELGTDLPVDLGISILRDNTSLIEHNTRDIKVSHQPHAKHRLTYKVPLKYFNPGIYEVAVAIFEKKKFKLIGFNTGSCKFIIDEGGASRGGLLSVKGEWITGASRKENHNEKN